MTPPRSSTNRHEDLDEKLQRLRCLRNLFKTGEYLWESCHHCSATGPHPLACLRTALRAESSHAGTFHICAADRPWVRFDLVLIVQTEESTPGQQVVCAKCSFEIGTSNTFGLCSDENRSPKAVKKEQDELLFFVTCTNLQMDNKSSSNRSI